jgi:hypothetical protein
MTLEGRFCGFVWTNLKRLFGDSFFLLKKFHLWRKSVSLKFETDIVVDLFIAKESEVEV